VNEDGQQASSHPRVAVPLHPAAGQTQKHHGFRSNQRFWSLPPPTGGYPYRLRLEDILSPEEFARIGADEKLRFHLVGDTGGVKSPEPQQIVAWHMDEDFAADPAPSFFYHLGDVVYYNGSYSEYYPQFYEPYAHYPAPIVAIPGNHDGDPLDPLIERSLASFVSNFCAAYPHLTLEAQEVQRDAMVQPNVYWTLLAPYLTIVGLYTNVPEGGRLDQDQIDWLAQELAEAPQGIGLAVACHHPIYSADAHHGGSAYMGAIIDAAIAASGRRPDVVLTAHVHNYQRFTRTLEGKPLTYLVAGAGGYWHLHYMAKDDNGQPLQVPWQVPGLELVLESFVEDRHGYLRVTASERELGFEYVTVPRPQESWRHGPVTVADSFTIPVASARSGRRRDG